MMTRVHVVSRVLNKQMKGTGKRQSAVQIFLCPINKCEGKRRLHAQPTLHDIHGPADQNHAAAKDGHSIADLDMFNSS